MTRVCNFDLARQAMKHASHVQKGNVIMLASRDHRTKHAERGPSSKPSKGARDRVLFLGPRDPLVQWPTTVAGAADCEDSKNALALVARPNEWSHAQTAFLPPFLAEYKASSAFLSKSLGSRLAEGWADATPRLQVTGRGSP